jgi:hypothetical protein
MVAKLSGGGFCWVTKGSAFGWEFRYCSTGVGFVAPGPLAVTAFEEGVEISGRRRWKAVEAVHDQIGLRSVAQLELDRKAVRACIGIGIGNLM